MLCSGVTDQDGRFECDHITMGSEVRVDAERGTDGSAVAIGPPTDPDQDGVSRLAVDLQP